MRILASDFEKSIFYLCLHLNVNAVAEILALSYVLTNYDVMAVQGFTL